MKLYKHQFLEYPFVSIWKQGTKSILLPTENFLQLKSFFQTFIEKINLVVMDDKWGWVWKLRKIFMEFFFWKFWTIKILVQRTKSTVSHLYSPLQVLSFRLSSWWKKLKLQWLRNTSLPIGRNKKISTFWILRTIKIPTQVRRKRFFSWTLFYKICILDWDADG